MKTKILFIGSLLSMSFLLSGCVEQNTNVVINADGSADASQTILVSKEVASMAKEQGGNVSDSLLDEIKKEFSKENGYKTKSIEKDGEGGVTLSKHFKKTEDVFKDDLFSSDAVKQGTMKSPWTVKVDKGFFETTTSIKGEINYEKWLTEQAGLTEEEAKAVESMGDAIDVNYSFTTPVQAISQNADKVDNRTYTWKMGSDKNKTLQLKFHVLNMPHVLTVSGVGIVALFTGLFFLKRKQRRK